MNMVCTSKTLCCAIGAIAILFFSVPRLSRAATEPNNPQPGGVVRFDARNALTYIRHEPTDGDVTLELKYALDRTSQTWNLAISNTHLPIGSSIFGIHYTNPRHVWMISHLGKRFAGAALLNLKTKKIERGYAINDPYDISPDGLKLAYAFPNGARDLSHAVFINKVCIYPVVKILSESDDPQNYLDMEERDVPGAPGVTSEIQRLFTWQDNDTLRFIVEETQDGKNAAAPQAGHFIEYAVTGLEKAFANTPPNVHNIKIKKKELTPAEAQQALKEPFEQHYGKGSFRRWVKRHPDQSKSQ